jgi:hypothetical protein
VVIAVIGKSWLTATDAAGRERLQNPDDYVRREIAAALQRNIRVVPVLVQGASMPSADELPDDLAALTRRSAFELHDTSWGDDTRRLAKSLENIVTRSQGHVAAGSPIVPAEIPPISQVHGYSGRWRIQNRFSLWRNIELGENDRVFFEGTAFLLLPVDGEKGSGTQTGKVYILVDHYRAEYEVANEVLEATVDKEGTLTMRVKTLSRVLTMEEGKLRDDRFSGSLVGSRTFDLELKRVPGEPERLHGTHEYRVASIVHSKAEENYEYLGF